MRVTGLIQPPYDTTLVGVVKGALDHYGIDTAAAETFVLSGHAFVINIHRELCPSGPYCWHHDGFHALLPNLGIRMEELATCTPDDDAETRGRLEARVRNAMDRGSVCSVLNLDHQLLIGYDDTGFDLAQPWGEGNVDSTPRRLTFGAWPEFANGPPVTLFEITPCAQRSRSKAIAESLDFAVDFWRSPDRFAYDDYATGRLAYDYWLAAIDADHGDEHGNWWNGVVWGECRERAGDYFQDLAAAEFAGPVDQRQARELAIDYRALGRLLYRAADKTATPADKRRFVEQARDLEDGCVERIAGLR